MGLPSERLRLSGIYLMDLDPNGGLAPKLSQLFRRLLRSGEFLLEWWIADVTPVPKGPLSSLVCNYRVISITPVLSNVFERLISLRFGHFLESSRVLPSHQYSYRRILVPVMLFWTSSVLVRWNWTGVVSLRLSR